MSRAHLFGKEKSVAQPMRSLQELKGRRKKRERGGRVKDRAALFDATQFCQIDKFHSDMEGKFRRAKCLLHQSPASLPSFLTMAAITPLSPNLPPPPCLHNATLAEDGKKGTHSFRIPPDPTSGSCSRVLPQHTKRAASDSTHRNRFPGRIQKWLQNLRGEEEG